jgi:hypothetical protein
MQFLFSFFAFSIVQAQQNKFNLVVGTYTTPCENKGIYVYDFDSNTGNVTLKGTSENILNPSYLTLSDDNKKVYAVNQNDESSTFSSFALGKIRNTAYLFFILAFLSLIFQHISINGTVCFFLGYTRASQIYFFILFAFLMKCSITF